MAERPEDSAEPAADETKPDSTDISQEDFEQFDDLERTFHKVIQDLVTDRSLDSFRSEYEKLHAALVESHGGNAVLIDKCRAMNNEILSNANKVSSVMQLSQSDQRTIAGLRHEFEKAWKIVETAQDRENRSREVIDTLKLEISQLSRLVEQGGALAFTQESSLQETADAITSLKKEIMAQTGQLQSMTRELNTARQQGAEMRDCVSSLSKTHDNLTAEIEAERDHNKALSASADQLHIEIKQIKADFQAMQDQQMRNEQETKRRKSQLEHLTAMLKEADRDIRSLVEDKRMMAQRIHTLEKLLEERKQRTEKTREEVSRYTDQFASREAGKVKSLDKLKEAELLVEKTQKELARVKAKFGAVSSEKAETRAYLTRCRNEFFKLATRNSAEEFEVHAMRRALERRRIECYNMQSGVGSENLETKMIEGQTTILTNEILGGKVNAHRQRGRIEQINSEIDAYQGKASNARSNIIQIEEEVQIREKASDALNIKLSRLYEQIKQQENRLETIQNERDFSCRQLEAANSDNEQLLGENKGLSISIHTLKNEIREKDRLCLETHMRSKQIAQDLTDMNKKAAELGEEIRVTEEHVTEYRNKIQRSLHLAGQADLDIMKQKQVVTDLKLTSFALNDSVTRKAIEAQLIKEKAGTIAGILTMGQFAYRKQSEDLDRLQADLDVGIQRQKELLARVSHRRALMLEQIRIQKALIQESGKVRALEDEIEKPLNVHRWRFLDGTNPELAQLLRMNDELRDRLMLKINVLARLKVVKSNLTGDSKVLDTHLTRSYCGNIQEEFDFLTSVLRHKTKQLSVIQQRVTGQTDTLTEHKDQVLTMRLMVRSEKEEYFDAKKKVAQFKAADRPARKDGPANSIRETRYIGGGFPVADVIRGELGQPPPTRTSPQKKTSTSALGNAHIVRPTSMSALSPKKLPMGWSPQRGPLRSILPTVSSLSSSPD
jgi:DNA repair exonuclease SbcCD ATPase subunit